MAEKLTKKPVQQYSRYKFIGSESDLESHILDNIHDVAKYCEWGEIQRVERQFRVPIVGYHVIADIMIWHTDGSGTLIECKTGKTNRNDALTGIGQVLFYGTSLKAALGEMPRLVIAAPVSMPHVRQTIRAFALPIHLLTVDGDRCIYDG